MYQVALRLHYQKTKSSQTDSDTPHVKRHQKDHVVQIGLNLPEKRRG